ncbi:MAG: hypothetical protein N2747_06180 [Chitinophagaceae bacterium]|nr:hypothetical protein [Chitinophagaceae bacterium]
MTFIIGGFIGFLLVNNLTSTEVAQQYQLDKLMQNIEYQRQMYAYVSMTFEGKDSYFEINASNPVMMILSGLVATLFRPFLWDIKAPIMFLAFIEASIFLFLTLNFIFRKGLLTFFKNAFSEPVLLFCFVFSFLFASAVGMTAANFGALSRYKIPCLPFYLFFLILQYQKMNLQYPRWFQKLINFAVPAR